MAINLFTTLAAVSGTTGVLVALLIDPVLLLVVAGLIRKVRRLQRQLRAERQTHNEQITAGYLEQSRLHGDNMQLRNWQALLEDAHCYLSERLATLSARVGDLTVQRHALGMELFDCMAELETAEQEARSANRQLWAAERALKAAREDVQRVECLLRGAQAENRRLRRENDQLVIERVLTPSVTSVMAASTVTLTFEEILIELESVRPSAFGFEVVRNELVPPDHIALLEVFLPPPMPAAEKASESSREVMGLTQEVVTQAIAANVPLHYAVQDDGDSFSHTFSVGAPGDSLMDIIK